MCYYLGDLPAVQRIVLDLCWVVVQGAVLLDLEAATAPEAEVFGVQKGALMIDEGGLIVGTGKVPEGGTSSDGD